MFSYITDWHQRDKSANGKLLYHIASEFKYPKDFESLTYISQIMQAESVRFATEHNRRNRNDFRCMGTLYWQVNDCDTFVRYIQGFKSIDFAHQ